jgi:hypothetical protein
VRRRSGIAGVVKLTDRDRARGAAPASWARAGAMCRGLFTVAGEAEVDIFMHFPLIIL